MKKIQDAKILGTQMVEGKEVPVIQPEVYNEWPQKHGNEVDSEEQATGTCSNCGQPWSVHKAKCTIKSGPNTNWIRDRRIESSF